MDFCQYLIVYYFLAFTFFKVAVCSEVSIIGGKDVKKPLPWMVSIQKDEAHVCGGILIHNQWVLTAAFCKITPTSSVTVLIGSLSLSKVSKGAQRVGIHSYKYPKTFNAETKQDDIMLIKLNKKVKGKPQKIPKKEKDVPLGTNCVVTGWGTTNVKDSKPSDKLQMLEVMVMLRKRCNLYYNGHPVITEDMLCAGGKQEKTGTCWVSWDLLESEWTNMKSLKAKFRKSDAHEWNKNDERLLSAVEHGEADKVTSLLSKKGACPTKLDSEGKSALHVAATRGQAECLAVILAHGADVSLQDASAASGDTVIVQLLCEHKCHVNLKDSDGFTPLLLSARHAHTEVCQSLLDWGADINARDKNGRTAVLLASESSCPAAVELLVQRGADLQMVDSLGHDVLHYAKLSGSSEVQTILNTALHRQQSESDKTSARTPQSAGVFSPPYFTPTETPLSSKSDSSKRFNYKEEEELKSAVLKEEIEKLHEEKSMLLETIEDLKQIVEQTEPKASTAQPFNIPSCGSCFDLQPLLLSGTHFNSCIFTGPGQKRPAPQGEEGQGSSRPNSIESNASYHSTRADFELSSDVHIQTGDEEDLSELSVLDISGSPIKHEIEDDTRPSADKEIRLLRDALENLQTKLLESKMENRTLQARLNTDFEKIEVASKSMGEDTQKCQEELQEDNVVQKFQYLKSCLEQEVKDLKEKLAISQEEQKQDSCLIKDLQAQLKMVRLSEEERQELKNTYDTLVEDVNQEKALLIEKYKESQEEIRMLQEALRGTVPVEAAAKDFEEMKAELGEIIDGLQRRLLELSKSYSEAKSELSAARNQLQSKASEPKDKADVACVTKEEHEQKIQELVFKMKDMQKVLKDTEAKHQAALKEIAQVKQDAENQAQSSVAIADHTQVVASLGNAMKNLESEVEVLKEQLAQKTSQVDALQSRLTVKKDVTPNDSLSRLEYEQMRKTLEGEISHLNHLLKDALRKQDELALEVTTAWQEVKDARNEREAAQELAVSREQECSALNTKYREAQEVIVQLKKQVENHVISERDKNKKIDELSKEVMKLKEALNSLSQLSYTTSTPKRQQNQQVDSLQQQIKQLQYQLAGLFSGLYVGEQEEVKRFPTEVF
ncbi:ankycorbin-like protein [Labeo rohita]|uniref:trypsin n=1 Tax=Labeo rohita TaxID=84645 RepID=A0A498NC59_LABRO|nr:ankycorbin-like protein [Labeo rohita]